MEIKRIGMHRNYCQNFHFVFEDFVYESSSEWMYMESHFCLPYVHGQKIPRTNLKMMYPPNINFDISNFRP